jgi:histidinol-phosphatase (PHP family)
LFEIIGHADLPKKFGFIPQRDCTPLFEKFLDSARKADVAVELNTAGLRKDCKEIYPSPKILRLAHERGVPMTFGSDAHAPGEVGMELAKAIELARTVGYKHSCRFVQRKRDLVSF